MHKPLFFAALCIAAAPVRADVTEAVRDRLLPGYAAFAEAAAALDRAARGTCDAAALRLAFNAAWDAWLPVSFVHLVPGEDEGRTLAIAFWPDPKGLGEKAQDAMIAAKDPSVCDPAVFSEQSIAARGLTGLERLLYPAEPIVEADYACALTRATAADLARMADDIAAGWKDYAASLTTPTGGGPFQDPTEARQALLTQLAAGLEFVADQRLGRPLGTFEKPHPDRAEAKASGRSLRNVILSLRGMQAHAAALSPDSTVTQAAFDRAIGLAEKLDDPLLAGVANPQARLKIEILQGAVKDIRLAVESEMATALGAGIGFNSADGD